MKGGREEIGRSRGERAIHREGDMKKENGRDRKKERDHTWGTHVNS